MWRDLRGEWGAARAAHPSRLDTAITLAAIVAMLLEAALRPLVLPALQISTALGIALTLRWRRSRPLAMTYVAFTIANLITAVEITRALPELGLYTTVVVLLHPYALLRHGSRREIALGLPALLLTYLGAALAGEIHDAKEAVGSLVFFSFPGALGAAVRFRALAARREVQHAQLLERQMLARELHDTVAHHASAIFIQAQAARAVAGTRPEAVLDALLAIEGEAARSLSELRALVGALREESSATLSPTGRAEAIEELVQSSGGRFEQRGEIESLAPAVHLALHRIARESLYNVRQHARDATQVDVRLHAEHDSVRLIVQNDGALGRSTGAGGFGLVGMRERALLLGGSFEAGPLAAGGFRVEVVLPRGGDR